MSKVIIFTGDTGNTVICFPTGELPIEQVQARDIPAGVESFIVDIADLPGQDADFIDAWEQTNGVVAVNLGKAKEIAKARLRELRAPLLAAQDILFQRALETGADTTAIVAEKQRLRDITKLADACTTLQELRAIQC